MKTTICTLAAGFALAFSAAFAFDADTVAFYGFKDGASGNEVGANTVTNHVGAGYAGTLSLGGSASSTVIFTNAAPAKYIFASGEYGSETLCTDPQSVYFAGGGAQGDQTISFADIGTLLSSNTDFTIEFFFKGWGTSSYTPMLEVNCGIRYNHQNGWNDQDAVGLPYPLYVIMTGSAHDSIWCYVKSYHITAGCLLKVGASYPAYNDIGTFDYGMWHHYAIVYERSKYTFTQYLDYGLANTGNKRATNEVMTASLPLKIGGGIFSGCISAVRVTKSALATGGFMRATNDPHMYPDTVFHWSLDDFTGTNGAPVASRVTYDPCAGQYVSRKPRVGTGVVNISGEVGPVSTNELAGANKRFVVMEGDAVAENLGSAFFAVDSNPGGAAVIKGGSSVRMPGSNHYNIDSGSFTMECFAKIDTDGYKERVVNYGTSQGYCRCGLMGLMKEESGCDFGLWLMYQSDGWKIKIMSYKPGTTGYFEEMYQPKGKFLMDDEWHHFAIVYDDTTHVFTLYVDGKDCLTLQHPEAFVPRTVESKRVYIVGDKLVAGGFHGLIDEVRLTRRALAPSEFLSFRRSPYKTILIIR